MGIEDAPSSEAAEGPRSKVDLDFFADVAEDLVLLIRELFDSFNSVTLNDFLQGKKAPLYRACLARQLDGFQAITALTRADLGHVAPAYLRPACEEYFWIKYLNTLQPQDFRDFLLQVANYENLRGLHAQQMYIGKKGMKHLGFPTAFINEALRRVNSGKQRISDIGDRLGWPSATESNGGLVGLPSTHWIANKVSEGKLYDYLYSATSRHVHFSAGELIRRTEVQADEEIDYMGAGKRSQRSFFALYWGASLLIKTTSESVEGGKESSEPPEGFETRAIDIAERLGRHGIPSLFYSHEWRGAWD
ncbi:DUF5677 domain-containing protein [Streptomyces tubercidicus]|uniref:DUF5677 domain-containing protein n=1 Tax=Streptomyces tubercidicus TaxID=47759 RepID=UPI002E126443|nr:DUF5677 domain-containing protein [Streptomyces tubercidicus]